MPPQMAVFVRLLASWEEADYDGLKGHPPEWLPAPLKKQFFSSRAILCSAVAEKKATFKEVRCRFDCMVRERYWRVSHALAERRLGFRDSLSQYDEDLSVLVKIYRAVQLGPEEGLRALVGDDAAKGYMSRMAHQHRDDYWDKKEVQQIGLDLWKKNASLTITAIERDPSMVVYRRKYKGRHTLRNWLKSVDPRSPLRKRGRPRQKK